jgi:3-oxoacyl-[acyl-carrier-protein] synthase-3
MTRVRFLSTGMWVPERVLTNRDLERMVDTSDEWITTRTGIKERRIADEKTGAADMGARAALAALEDGGLHPNDVDAILVATATPDRLLPATACDIQAMIGARNAVAFDVWGACTGWLYAVNVGKGLIGTGQARTVLVIGTEKLSSIVDWSDRSTCVLFGDAAGAAVLVPHDGDDGRGVLATYMRSDGSLGDLLYRPPARGLNPSVPIDVAVLHERDKNSGNYIRMAGPEVFKAAVRSMCEAAEIALRQAGVTADDVDLLIPHQANIRIIEATAKYAGIPMERVWTNIDRYGNTSSASIPVSIDEARRCGRIREGSLLLLVAFGSGFTWASAVVRW